MKPQEQTGREYLAGLNEKIEAMAPIERVSSMAMINLGKIIAELINNHQWDAIEGMRETCGELFEQAVHIEYEEKNRKLQ